MFQRTDIVVETQQRPYELAVRPHDDPNFASDRLVDQFERQYCACHRRIAIGLCE